MILERGKQTPQEKLTSNDEKIYNISQTCSEKNQITVDRFILYTF